MTASIVASHQGSAIDRVSARADDGVDGGGAGTDDGADHDRTGVPPGTPAYPAAIAGGLRQGRFCTNGLMEEEARHAYLDRLDGIVDTIFLAPFSAELDAYRLDTFSVLCLSATARVTARTGARIAYDRYDSIGVQFIVSGKAIGEANGRATVSNPGTVMILDYDQPFSMKDIEPRVVVNVTVPRGLFVQACGDPTDHHGEVLQGTGAAMLARFMGDLGRTLPDFADSAGAGLARVFLELLAVALNKDAGTVADGRDALLIRRAERLVDDRIGSPVLDPAWLASKMGLSRSDLYAVMEPFGGVSRFIMYRRLNGARAALENVSDPRRIGAIAYAFGFSSEAHFSRAFRAAFGTTASAIRRISHGRKDKNFERSGKGPVEQIHYR